MEIQGPWMKLKTRNKYLFGSTEHDNFIGPSDNNARYLDKSLGRFVGADMVSKVAPARNSYRYGFNRPINLTDPTGLMEESSSAETRLILMFK